MMSERERVAVVDGGRRSGTLVIASGEQAGLSVDSFPSLPDALDAMEYLQYDAVVVTADLPCGGTVQGGVTRLKTTHPEVLGAFLLGDDLEQSDLGFDLNEQFICMAEPRSRRDADLVLSVIRRIASERRELRRSAREIQGATGAAQAFMQSHQELAGIVHCGQEIQGELDLERACEKITTALEGLGLESSIHFVEEADVAEYKQIAADPERHLEVEGSSARLYFATGAFAGRIDVRVSSGERFDMDRYGDLLHLVRNQLLAFLERLGSLEEREKLLSGYKAILDKLEAIIEASDVSGKTSMIRKELENDTENIFNLLDRMRETTSEEMVPWLDQVEMSLQFSDRVSQQINALAGVIREILAVMRPEEDTAATEENKISSNSVLEPAEKRQEADAILASLGL